MRTSWLQIELRFPTDCCRWPMVTSSSEPQQNWACKKPRRNGEKNRAWKKSRDVTAKNCRKLRNCCRGFLNPYKTQFWFFRLLFAVTSQLFFQAQLFAVTPLFRATG